MKTKLILLVVVLSAAFSVNYPQSDYQKMQDFKKQIKNFESEIKGISSLRECENISERISMYKNESLNDKEFLDKALYPEDYESSFERIENMLDSRKGDFTQITFLTTKVETLQTHLSELSQRTEDLLAQIKSINDRADKNEKELSSMKRLVSQLRSNIHQRDMLVKDLVDSLLTGYVKSTGNLNLAERKTMLSKINSGNLFYNVERTVADNIEFIKATPMTPDDFKEMKEQYKDFHTMWNKIGAKLGSVYLNKKNKKSEIAGIDSLFGEWDKQIKVAMWHNVNQEFAEKDIVLPEFKNSGEFVSTVNSFIDDEIKNADVKSDKESEKVFSDFTSGVYFKRVEPDWIPVLISNDMMTKADKDSIDSKIAVWQAQIAPTSPVWIYILVAMAVVALCGYLLIKEKKGPTRPAHAV